MTQVTRWDDGEGFESPPGRFSSPVLDFSPGCSIHTHTPLDELQPWVGCRWGLAMPPTICPQQRGSCRWSVPAGAQDPPFCGQAAAGCFRGCLARQGVGEAWPDLLWWELNHLLLAWARAGERGVGAGAGACLMCHCSSFPHVLGKAEPLQQEVREEVPDCGGAVQGAPAHRFLSQDGDEAGNRAGGEWGHRQDPLRCLHRLHPVSSPALAAPCLRWAPGIG